MPARAANPWDRSEPGPAVKVAVFEPRQLVAEGLAALLADADDLEVVRVSTSATELKRTLLAGEVGVVVFGVGDYSRERIHGLVADFNDAAAAHGQPVAMVCVLPSGAGNADRLSSVEVSVVVETSASPQRLRDAIAYVFRRSPKVFPQRVVPERLISTGNAMANPTGLTPRERDVLRCLARGLSTEEIALRMGISRNTVRTHIQHLLPKLGVHTRLQAAAIAVSDRLVAETDGADEGRGTGPA